MDSTKLIFDVFNFLSVKARAREPMVVTIRKKYKIKLQQIPLLNIHLPLYSAPQYSSSPTSYS